MSTKADRLKEARVRAGFSTASDAAERFGWRPPTYLAHENGSRGFSPEKAAAYARAFKVEPEWLLFERNEGAARAVDIAASEEAEASLVPVYAVSASAGGGSVVEEEPIVYSMAFPPKYLQQLTSSNPRHLSIISVKGDSMLPTLKDDDIVMLDLSKTNLNFDGLFVLRFGEALHVKRVGRSGSPGRITVLSDNRAEYPAVEYAEEDVRVVGKVIWYGRKV